MDFTTSIFGDFAKFRYGKMPKKSSVKENGKYPIYSGYRYVGYYDEYNTEANQLIIVARGVGGTGDVKLTKEKCYLTNLSISVEIDTSIALPEYLYYYFSIRNLRYLDSGSAQSQITISDLARVEIPLPNIEIQKKIVHCLGVLDRKISANEAINDNLEQQAQALYQELFITNTDPSWETGTISNLGTVIGGSTPSKARPEYYTKNGIAWITPKDLSINKSKFITHGESDITELGLKNSSATVMPEGTVLFSSRAPIGYIAIAAGNITTNQGFKSVVPNAEIGTAYVYYYLKQNLSMIERLASGSTFKEVSGGTMKSVPAIVPDSKTIQEFNNFCLPIFEQQKVLETQNRTLAGLRDSLLPKLMSGELDVSAVEL